jgi:hypothetical protein
MFWISVALFAIGTTVFLFAVLIVGARADRKARHVHHSIDPFADVTITRQGE